MLKVARSPLPAALQAELDRRQAAVDNNTGGNSPWEDFIAFERKQASHQQPTIKEALKAIFHGKCAYCETNNAREIEHHWPRSPHLHNGNRGSSAQMFRWDNLIWACHTCNSFECKGAHMAWDGSSNQ